ncbi:MAG: TIGR00300 family protein [Planctomycetes bacterium]|nr:TIGR00300 family protein [Planctomycetota bacterium]
MVAPFVSEVEVAGHIIDGLILPKILDCITAAGGSFQIKRISVGQERKDPSYALLAVTAPSQDQLEAILADIRDHGAAPIVEHDCRLETADRDGAFPEGFYATTNQRTEVRRRGEWVEVRDQEMDCGIAVDPATGAARCVAMSDVGRGQAIVVGYHGVRAHPQTRDSERNDAFEFMNSAVSTEKPKGVAIRQVADEMRRSRDLGQRILVVAGPAVIHTGSGGHFCELIRAGYVQTLFAGNALATHDIEQALFGTSLGVRLDRGDIVEAGHEHHLRTINRIRRVGGIRRAVATGLLRQGIMYECVRRNVDFLLAGSIRDDGPLPEVMTDVIEAQSAMRQKLANVGFCLMVATTLHSIAVGNLLPAWVRVVCVDINPSTVIKLNDRGSFQTLGIVTDVEPFLRALVDELVKGPGAAAPHGVRV